MMPARKMQPVPDIFFHKMNIIDSGRRMGSLSRESLHKTAQETYREKISESFLDRRFIPWLDF
jgi:hypothetical protein